MSRKISEMEKTERRSVEETLDSASANLGMDSWESQGTGRNNALKDLIGMCYNCKNLYYCRTEFGNVYAFCERYEIKLTGQNRIVECNTHAPNNSLSLQEMYSMAYLIEPKEKTIKGFLGNP